MSTPTVAPSTLALADLHGSLSDPLLDSMNFLNEITARFPDAISFGPGRPPDEPFDADRVAGYLRTYTTYLQQAQGLSAHQVGQVLFQYGRTKGQIHELVAETVANDDGIVADPEAVVVTVGAQEGMLLVLRALIRDPGDVLLVSSPCYVGITGAARVLDTPVAPVPEGPDGIDPEAVRAVAAAVRARGRRPRALYVVPDFANPSGVRMPLPARNRLLAVAAEQDLLVLEDNPYGLFDRHAGTQLPPLKALDTGRRVIYLGSFAKTCFPGARIGYVIADQEVIADQDAIAGHGDVAGQDATGGQDADRYLLADALAKIKSMTTVNTSPLAQATIGGMLLASGCRLRTLNEDRIRRHRARLDALTTALRQHLGDAPGVSWRVPDGGFFLVVTVPFIADEAALGRSGRDHGVLWTPMSFFYPDGGGAHQLRLSCSYLEVDQIHQGVRRLAAFLSHPTGSG